MKRSIFLVLKEKKRVSRILAMMLVLCMIFTSFEGSAVLANSGNPEQTPTIWTGAETAPTKGAGTAEDPYQIGTAEELAYVVKNNGGANTYYKLTSDIYLNDVTAENWQQNTNNHAWYSLESNFQGHVDGAGHIVYGLWYKENNTGRFAGLIPRLSGGSVKNLGVRYASVNAAHSAGGVVGYGISGATKVIDQCFVDETVTVKTPSNAAGGAGGIVGLLSGVNKAEEQVDILNCYSKATVQGASGKWNGIIGSSWQSKYTMKNCYSVGTKPFSAGNANQASSLWKNSAGTVLDETVYQNVYSNKAVYTATWEPFTYVEDVSEMQGEAAKTSMPGLNYETIFRIVEDDTPKLKVFPEQADDDITIWTGAETAPTKGAGTAENPYQIGTAEELAYVVKNNGGANTYYKLTSDIYLNDVTAENWQQNTNNHAWYSLESNFQGHVDGTGHIVYGLWYKENNTGRFAGLIPRLSGGSVKNLGVRYASVNAAHSAGGVVGYGISGATKVIDQCFVDETVTVKTPSNAAGGAGGIVGLLSGVNKAEERVDILNCYSKATVQGASGKWNGIIGSSWQSKYTMKNCYSVGTKPFSAGNANQASSLWKNSAGTVLDETVYQNVYSNKAVYTAAWEPFTYVEDVSEMQGEAAKTSMPGLNYETIFRIVEDDTPKLKVFPEQTDSDVTIWTGAETAPTKGAGTAENPYQIGTAEELAYVVKNNGGANTYYKLTSDIYLNDVTAENWYENTENHAWYSLESNFQGHVDGTGHIVYGLWYKENNTGRFAGLIPRLSGGSVKNLGVRYASVNAAHSAGGVVGYGISGATKVIDQCFVDETVTVKTPSDAAGGAGGIVGLLSGVNKAEEQVDISNCYSKAKLQGVGGKTSGIIGTSWDSKYTMKNCYSVGARPLTAGRKEQVSKLWTKGGGSLSDTEVYQNIYTDDQEPTSWEPFTYVEDADSLRGEAAKTSMPGLNYETVFRIVEGDTPELMVFPEKESSTPEPGDPDDEPNRDGQEINGIWTGVVAEKFVQGSGKQDDPYIIATGAEFAFAIQSGGKNRYYKLSKDIYLNDVTAVDWYKNAGNHEWFNAPAGTEGAFRGHIDGDGHIVYGLWYAKDTTGVCTGLIPKLSGGSVKNLGVRYAYVNAARFAAGIIGYPCSGSAKTVDRCFVDDTVTVSGSECAGGLIGQVSGVEGQNDILEISNCYSKAAVAGGSDRANGIMGTAWNSKYTIKNCYSVGAAPYTAERKERVSRLCPENGNGGTTPRTEVYRNIYTDERKTGKLENFTYVGDVDALRGSTAKTTMSGLDFKNIFEVVEGATPKLKIFTQYDGYETDLDAVNYASGKGTKADPYIIKTAEHLRNMCTSIRTKGKYYKIVNDIYINDTTNPNWMNANPQEWVSYLEWNICFAGYLEGNGHEIHGIYIKREPLDKFVKRESAGLFGWLVDGAVVRNVHIRDSYITSSYCAGAISGLLRVSDGNYAVVTGCSADETVTLKGYTAGGLIGGGARGLELSYSYSTANVDARQSTGPSGLVGDIWSVDYLIAECYSIGYQNVRSSFIPSSAFSLYGDVAQQKTICLTREQMKGSVARTYMKELSWDTVWYTVEGKYPQLNVIPEGMSYMFYNEGTRGGIWSGRSASKFAGGSGTKEDPYIIETPEQLALCVSTPGSSTVGKYYKLTADIKLNDTSYKGWEKKAKNWYSGYLFFKGHFDGNGHVVSGLFYDIEDGSAKFGGVFPYIGYNAVIENLGVTESSISLKSTGTAHTLAGSIVGAVNDYVNEKGTPADAKMPVIRQCFADHTVSISAGSAGGIVGGVGGSVKVENCYFTGKLTKDTNCGGLIGDIWEKTGKSSLTNSFCYTVDGDSAVGGVGQHEMIQENVYAFGTLKDIKGELAKETLKGFDFSKIWRTVEGGTPVLRVFGTTKYTCTRRPNPVEIAFVSNGGSECEPITGYPLETELSELPKPTRYGYTFAGWYHYAELDVPCKLKYFPSYSIVLYAKWIPIGFTVDFEGNYDKDYDYNSTTEHYTPGVAGYKATRVHGGIRSMHCKEDSETNPMFLLSYENKLEVGTEYDFNFWMATDTKDASGVVELLSCDYPDINAEALGSVGKMELTGSKVGEWEEYRITFTADAPYLFVSAPQNASLYFDDIKLVPVGTGENGAIDDSVKLSSSSKDWIVVVCVVVVVAAGVIVAVYFVNKRRKGKENSVSEKLNDSGQ